MEQGTELMKTTIAFAFLSLVLGFTSTVHAASVTFDWATIGDPGNAGDFSPGGGVGTPSTNFGVVSNVYRISKTEVTNAQYAEFLNEVDPFGTNSLNLFNPEMATSSSGGIANNGSAFGDVASGIRAQNPVTFVSWLDAARFTNWLQNGQAGGDTESGVYDLTDPSLVRNSSATYFLPSQDEWYKAAYYDPNKAGGAGYYDYATGSDSIPASALPSDDPAAVNYTDPSTGTATGYPDFPADTPLTAVGAYTDAASPYGTFDQNGNVREWNEAFEFTGSADRGVRGGSWNSGPLGLQALDSFPFANGAGEFNDVGFRVASAIPEPSTLLLGALASLGLLMPKRR